MSHARDIAAALACTAVPLTPAALAQPDAHDTHPALTTDAPAPDLDADRGWRVTGIHAYWDNDGAYADPFDREDRHYTNGAKLELTLDPALSPELRERIAPAARWPNATIAAGVVVAQHLYTATDIAQADPPADDHPYAAWLYAGFYIQRRSGNIHDHAELDVGVVGSWALGEELQTFVHAAFTNQVDPEGWDTQLANELAINLRLQRSWRSERASIGGPDGLELDAIPRLGADLGNVFIRANADVTIRVGKHLPDDFGPARLLDYRDATGSWSKDHDWGLYTYTRLGMRAVGRSIFLDGNTFADSRSTDREPLVGEVEVGLRGAFEAWGGTLEIGYGWTAYSHTYEAQEGSDTVGSWSAGWTRRF